MHWPDRNTDLDIVTEITINIDSRKESEKRQKSSRLIGISEFVSTYLAETQYHRISPAESAPLKTGRQIAARKTPN